MTHDTDMYIQYRSKILGPKYACNVRLGVRDARVCIFDMRMKYAQKVKSIVFMS